MGIDIDTGEVYSLDRFIQMYNVFLDIALELSSIELKVLFLCIKESNCNRFIVNKLLKERFANILGVSSSCISNTLSKLYKRSLLIRYSRGEYLINPRYFFNGRTIYRGYSLL